MCVCVCVCVCVLRRTTIRDRQKRAGNASAYSTHPDAARTSSVAKRARRADLRMLLVPSSTPPNTWLLAEVTDRKDHTLRIVTSH
ncbi:MAG: hypothetical protein ACK41O_27050, partial [Runella zeae]